MDWKIIPDEQTPEIPSMGDIGQFMKENKAVLESFLSFASVCSKTAVGLAGNQVSLDGERFMQRVFAIKNTIDKSWRLIVNPEITEYMGIKELKDEGCLTWVGKTIVAERYRRVKVSYYDIDGKKHEGEIYKNFDGQIWQHEVSHLNGIIFRIEDGSFELPPEKRIGRNDVCPCKSGKKYKNCCIQ